MADASVYSLLATQIVKNQAVIIGPLAIDQASMVSGISITPPGTVTIMGNGKEFLVNLVNQFERLFGTASIEVCKDAVKESHVQISDKDLPDILK
jgi:hypothetical protein